MTLDVKEKNGRDRLRKLTQALQILAVLGLAYSAAKWYAFSKLESLPALGQRYFEPKTAARDELGPDPSMSFTDYSRVFSQREIFVIPYAKEASVPRGDIVESPVAQKSQLVDFRLRGIVLDQHPQAIIEDLANKQTLFLFSGDSLGQGTLKEIREDRIVVVIHDSSVELLLED